MSKIEVLKNVISRKGSKMKARRRVATRCQISSEPLRRDMSFTITSKGNETRWVLLEEEVPGLWVFAQTATMADRQTMYCVGCY